MSSDCTLDYAGLTRVEKKRLYKEERFKKLHQDARYVPVSGVNPHLIIWRERNGGLNN